MKILVIGGTGLTGRLVTKKLAKLGHQVVIGSPSHGVDLMTGEGLDLALQNTEVVIDLSNSSSPEEENAIHFFLTAGKNLVTAELAANIRHHLVLSIVGTDDALQIDVTDDSSVSTAFENVLEKYGKIDVLVNNAAVSGFGLLEAYSLDRIRQMFEVNFYGVIRTYQAVLPSMREHRSGLIINITSGASAHTSPFMVPYFASKFGVESITEGLQDELKQFNIENVSIQPGVYPTEMNTGEKNGVNADKPEIAERYDPVATEQFNAIGAALFGKMKEFNMNPQTIANGILELIQMKEGSRPLRFPLDAVAQGTDLEFINARAELKAKWLAKYSD